MDWRAAPVTFDQICSLLFKFESPILSSVNPSPPPQPRSSQLTALPSHPGSSLLSSPGGGTNALRIRTHPGAKHMHRLHMNANRLHRHTHTAYAHSNAGCICKHKHKHKHTHTRAPATNARIHATDTHYMQTQICRLRMLT